MWRGRRGDSVWIDKLSERVSWERGLYNIEVNYLEQTRLLAFRGEGAQDITRADGRPVASWYKAAWTAWTTWTAEMSRVQVRQRGDSACKGVGSIQQYEQYEINDEYDFIQTVVTVWRRRRRGREDAFCEATDIMGA